MVQQKPSQSSHHLPAWAEAVAASPASPPLCPYDIRLWPLVTCADAWCPDGPANRARSCKSPLLWPVSPSLAVAVTLTSPDTHPWEAGGAWESLLTLGVLLAQREVLGPHHLLFWRLAPLSNSWGCSSLPCNSQGLFPDNPTLPPKGGAWVASSVAVTLLCELPHINCPFAPFSLS